MQTAIRRLLHLSAIICCFIAPIMSVSAEGTAPWDALLQRCLSFDKTTDVGAFLQRIHEDQDAKTRRFAPAGALDTTRCHSARATDDAIYCELLAGAGRLQVIYFQREDLLLLIGSHGLPSIKADGSGNKLLTEDVRQRLWKAAGRRERDDLRPEIMGNETLLPAESYEILQRIYQRQQQNVPRLSEINSLPATR